jgi:hypothetical protein
VSDDGDGDGFLTDPARALEERAMWEATFESNIFDAMYVVPGMTLVSASFPRWSVIATRLINRLPRLPIWATQMLYEWKVDEDASRAEIASALAATLATAAYNIHVLDELAARGFKEKGWVTRRDPAVRASHAAMDGTWTKLSNAFVMEGFYLQYPADRSTAPVHLTYRCRCVLIGRR